MSLSINNNSLSLNPQRQLAEHTSEVSRLIAKLASGARIEGASDDPAGQAISARMSSQLRGMSQVMRNINDGTSMLQVADSAMANIGDSLQRLRELAVQSGNGGMSDSDRGALQSEATQILAQITDVGSSTQFNGQTLFSQDSSSIGGDARTRRVIDGLKTGWLGSAEEMVKKYYGIEGDGATLKLNLATTDGAWNVLASVSGSTESNGKVGTLSLNLDMADFGGGTTADGGAAFLYNDRVVAHEMVHAIMDRSMNMVSLPKWFTEGTAELIQGADERLANAIAGGGVAAVVSGAAASDPSYEGAYAASRYLHDKLKEAGVEGGMKGLMTYLHEHQSANLDAALNAVTNGTIATASAFMTDFQANGATFITTRMNLANADTGAIGGLDADGGPVRNAKDVVSDVGYTSADKPLQNFQMDFGDLDDGAGTGINRMQIQVGAGTSKDDLIELQFSAMNAQALGLSDLDMSKTAVALLHIDQAIDFVEKQRVSVGAAGNRLDMAAANNQTSSINLAASQSRIQDVDYASSTAKLTRAQILQQAASAMLTQANGQPNAVLALLR
jgi:flagellin